MKNLWNAVSFVAVVNLLALLMFVGWLWQSGRLSADRVQHMRDVLAMTVEQEQAAEADAAEVARREAEAADEADRRENPPLPSAVQVNHDRRLDDRGAQSLRRVRDENRQLMAQLEQQRAQLAQREAAFDARQQAWMDDIAAERQRKLDEQFQQTVGLYESAKPKLAKQWMLELVDGGDLEQVVAYLDAMNPRAASKILNEFKGDEDAALATELLERLRRFGTGAEAAEDPSHDERIANADQS
jgi:flagellar motility protein MotE (MotC chaperone)